MTKISIYQIDEYVTADDKWIGTDVNTYNKTKNFTPRKLATYFNGSQVINTGVDLLYKYFTITPPEDRPAGTLSFETEIGATVDFSAISTFLLSKTTLKGNDVSEFLDFLVNSTSLIYKAKNINIFGSYKIVSVETYFLDPNFFVVTVDFLEGNGFIEEDEDYMISVVDLDKTIQVPQLVKETFDYESSNSFVVANEINNVLQVIVNTTSLHPEAYSYTLPSTVTVINELFAGDVITVVYNYIEEFLEVPDLQRVTNIGNHTTNNIVVDSIPGEYGSYTVTNTLNDLGTFQSYTSPINIDYQSVYAAYEMSINEIYSPTINFEMFIGQGIMQTSYTNGSDNTAARLYSGNSVNGASLYIEKNDVNGQLKIDDLTDNITLQFPDKPTGTYTIATTDDVSPNYWTKTGNNIQNNNTDRVIINSIATGGVSGFPNIGLTTNRNIVTSGQFGSNIGYGFGDQSSGMFESGGKLLLRMYSPRGVGIQNVYQNSTSGIQNDLSLVSSNINPTSGNAVFNNIALESTINQTGGANGITRGLYINPTLTSAADFRAIEVVTGKVIVPNAVNSNEAVNKGQVDNRLVVETASGYTLTNADSGGIVIFTASTTLTIPTGLADGFECTFVTLSGVTLTVVSTGNTLNNATSTTLLPQLSFTLKRMLAANTYIVAGSL